MKKNTLLLVFLCLSFFAKSQSADELAIQKTCETESRAWLEGDAEAFNKCWQIRPYSRILVSTEEGQAIAIEANQMKPADPESMGKGGGTVEISNYKFSINGSSAWVTHDEVRTAPDGSKHPSFEFRMLEKVDGDWKIVALSVHAFKAK